MTTCTIVIDRLADGRYRARCHLLPDVEAIASTEEEARQAVERSLEDFLRQRLGADPESSMNPIDRVFHELRARNRKAFIPFITAGDPDLETSTLLVRRLVASGASIVEAGFPYSDPIADGPVIQASYTRALAKGLRPDDIFAWAKGLTGEPGCASVPLVGMVSYSLIHRRGKSGFLDAAMQAGFSGLIVPDLPIDEAEGLAAEAAQRDLKLIQLVTPTTPPDRAARIVRLSTGFVYVVSITGITGERDRLPEQLLDQLRRLRQETDLPLCVGFGVSKPEHARMLREHVDGIIVGSAIVRRLEQAGSKATEIIVEEIGELVRSLTNALSQCKPKGAS
jgi:tryptophan synthase alpha chain